MTTGNSDGSDGDSLLPRAIADAVAVAIGLPLGADGAFLTAVTAPYLEAVAQRAVDQYGEDAKNRILDMLARAWQATGLSSATFASRVGNDEQTRLLTAATIKAASSTAWPQKVIALGRLLAKGLIAEDEAEIDLATLGLAAMTEMERPHVSLLDLLVNYTPPVAWGDSQAQPYPPRYFVPGRSWHAHDRKWQADAITLARPTLTTALDGLMGTLIRHGLAVENDEAGKAIEEALRGFEERGNQQAQQIRAGSRLTAGALQPHIPHATQIIRTWSPTELGEQLLGLYREAAEVEASLLL